MKECLRKGGLDVRQARRMVHGRMAKRVCVGECGGSRSVGRPRKRWIDTVNECLRKMVQDRSEWRGFVRGEGVHGA